MNKITYLFIPLLFTFHLTNSQDLKYGVGENTGTVIPEPAQGGPAGILNAPAESYIADGTKEYTVSYNSYENKITVIEAQFIEQKAVPLGAGSETVKIDLPPGDPDWILSDFYYSMILEPRSAGWAWYLNYDWTTFHNKLTELGNQGYRIENIDTYGTNVYDYGGTWTMDQQYWYWLLNYTDLNDFLNILNTWPNAAPRLRLIDFAITSWGSQKHYGAVGVGDNLGFWWIFNESNYNNFINWVNGKYSADQRLTDIEFYRSETGNLMCAGVTKDATFAQQVFINLSYSQFVSLNNQYISQGYRIVDFDKYYIGNNIYFAGLWNNDGIGYAYRLNDNNLIDFQNTVTGYISQGYKPIMVNVYDGEGYVAVAEDDNKVTEFNLQQNYPNPFNPRTTIKYSVPRLSNVTIKVFDVLGNEIETLVNEEKPAGTYEISWHAANLPSGVYFYQLKAGEFVEIKKMTLMK